MKKLIKIGIIPARFASTRFPGKPLVNLGGKSMINRVYEKALASELDRVVVATDNEEIAAEVKSFGGEVVMTNPDLPSGTDRCREAFLSLNAETGIVINIQGDEPFIDPSDINKVITVLENTEAEIATLISPALDLDEVQNPNRVKVVKAINGKALYFSRSPIPYNRSEKELKPSEYFIHIGIYGFKSRSLIEVGELEQGFLEKTESLEQLRWLENGYAIYTDVTKNRSEAIDTPEDLDRIEKKYFL